MAENQIIITTSSRVLNESNSHNGAIQRKPEHGAKQSYHVHHPNDENWQTLLVGASKNKLKRKKKLSASLTSVGDAVNQEKRTRIEGIQLNCRGKLHAKDTRTFESATVPVTTTAKDAVKTTSSSNNNNNVERPVIIGGVTTTNPAPPQRVKRKLQENLDTIQKLNALTEQLRLEVNGLKSTLITERGAVRALRAQNDADCRKWKSEIKKLQQTLETTKKSNCNVAKKPNEFAPEGNCTYISADGLINYEIQRLTNEIAVLKEANRTKDERSQIIGQADRLKAADMRQLKNAYENRLTHIQKSAKIEITRLLEEIKTKERNIGQLKKDLMILQNPKKPNETKFKTNETSQKPKKKPLTNNEKKPTTAIKVKNETEPISQAQVTTEITQLKNIELINNRKNAHKSTTIITTKTKQDEMRGVRLSVGGGGGGGGGTNVEGATAWMTTLLTNAASKPKDHNSDTDSALSSAPPSISPQPPSSGADSGVMWQTLQDLDKMQKEAEMCHKENERLQTELQMMKQDLLGAEKAALTVNELKQHIKDLEEQQLQLNDEANELREQNELLEFHILELEDDNDKLDMDGTCEGHCQRLENLLRKSTNQLEGQEKRCLQQLLQCVQQLDLDAGMPVDQSKSERTRHNRIVATVQPYSNSATPSAPPTPSKRCTSHSGSAWQSNSLSESGVFVECDLSVPPPHPHLQFYQERLDQLEGKLLVYESSGETQAKHLAQRLQRELQLEKELKELRDRQDQLIAENAAIEEAKCEFEEAENDTRLHLQRNEVELEILRQRNVELEFGKEALCAKYKDCRAECAILRDDLRAAETQLEHLHSERRTVKRELDSLRRSLPLLLIYRLWDIARMGNEMSTTTDTINPTQSHCAEDADGLPHLKGGQETMKQTYCQLPNRNIETDGCACREMSYLKEEVKSLRCQLKEVNSRHYEAMETADSHWVELEREYKQREEAYRAKEVCLKQKIAKLQDCLREDARAAAEKIQQLEEAEHGLKTCLVRLTKEHRDLLEENHTLQSSVESSKAQLELEAEQQQPLAVALENERRRSQALIDDLSFSKKMQHNTEEQLKQETDGLRNQIYSLKKDFMHIEVTNGELKEEVGTLEKKIGQMELQLKDATEKTRCLEDELRTKEEQCQIMEQKLGVCPEGFSLADELYDSPAKRAKRDEIRDLQTASQGLGCALRDIERRERELPTHKEFQTIACSVKQLADTLLCAKNPSEVSTACLCQSGDEVSAKALCKPCDEMDLDQDKPESSKPTISQGITERSMSQPTSRRGSQTSHRSSQPSSPSRRNSRPRGSARSQGGGTSQQEDMGDFSVGLTLGDSENHICKVPSSMMQFVNHDKQLDELENQKVAEKPISLRRKRKLCKRFIYRRMFRVRARRSGALPRHLEHSLSNGSFYSVASVHTVHSAKSLLSVKSQHAAILAPQCGQWTAVAVAQTDPIEKQCSEVQVSPSIVDVTIQVQPSTEEFGMQADNIGVEHRLLLLPTRTQRFIKLLQDAVKGNFKVDMFRERLLQAWESSEEFRDNMELLQNLYTDKPCPKYESRDSWESYEGFVSVVNCIETLKLAFRPNISTMLADLEENVNSRIVAFHNRKIESEYYCTLYYPVERRNSMIFTTDEE